MGWHGQWGDNSDSDSDDNDNNGNGMLTRIPPIQLHRSWAPPVFGNANQTSQAYLQRLQDFLAAQSGDSNMSSTDKPNNKRKGPASNAEIDTTAALKDSRRQSSSGSASASGSTPAASQRSPGSNGQAQHSHADQQRSGGSFLPHRVCVQQPD